MRQERFLSQKSFSGSVLKLLVGRSKKIMPVKVDTSGLDDFMRKTREFASRSEFTLTELFSDGFISQKTDFKTLQEMVDAGGINKSEDLDSEAWSQFVADHSQFAGWDDMRFAAYAELYRQKVK
jgi:hypothetical protein